ncbi:polyprenyl synthetase family protein [Nonomuraea jabiensis]|uniref:polyprenyl synthetase family protein n=1 Tax=Nonomuraea jabiensis TaxID=882448 RepID=UPI003D71D195
MSTHRRRPLPGGRRPSRPASPASPFGWTDGDGRPRAAGSKALRPTLAVLSARAAGADLERCLPAAAVALVHAFSLLHDDVMDDDPVRRHRPAAWTVFGRAQAILCGNALFALALELLLEQGTPGYAPPSARGCSMSSPETVCR